MQNTIILVTLVVRPSVDTAVGCVGHPPQQAPMRASRDHRDDHRDDDEHGEHEVVVAPSVVIPNGRGNRAVSRRT